jgi:hypothetical protein
MVVVNRLPSHRSPQLSNNALTSVPAELGQLSSLKSFMCVDAADCLAQLTHRTAPQQPARVAAARVGSFAGDDRDLRELLPFLSSPTDNCSRSSTATHSRSTLGRRSAHQLALQVARVVRRHDLALARRHPRARHRRAHRPPADLDLPALQLVEILDALFPNSIPLHKKWDLVVAVKHWHKR